MISAAIGAEVVTMITPAEYRMGAIGDEITEAHLAAKQAVSSALKHARRAGELLLEAKRDIKHGNWLSWLERNCPTISERTAQGYMKVARDWPTLCANTNRVADLPLRDALKLLAPPREHERKVVHVRENVVTADIPDQVQQGAEPDVQVAETVTSDTPKIDYYLGTRKRADRPNRIVEHSVLDLTHIWVETDLMSGIDVSALDRSRVHDWAAQLRKAARAINAFVAKLEKGRP